MGAIASNFAYSPTLSRTVSGAVYNAPTSEGLRSSALTIAEVLGLFVDRCTIVALCKTGFALTVGAGAAPADGVGAEQSLSSLKLDKKSLRDPSRIL